MLRLLLLSLEDTHHHLLLLLPPGPTGENLEIWSPPFWDFLDDPVLPLPKPIQMYDAVSDVVLRQEAHV